MQYKAPLRDIQFVMHELLDSESHYKTLPAFQEADRELMDSLFEMAASFAENELSPLNQSGDAEGCKFDNGKVTTPKGFKEAYDAYCELGFPALSAEEDFGGQNMPFSLSTVINEMLVRLTGHSLCTLAYHMVLFKPSSIMVLTSKNKPI